MKGIVAKKVWPGFLHGWVRFFLFLLIASPPTAIFGQQVISPVSPESAASAAEVSIAINPVNINNIVAGSLMQGYPDSSAPDFSFWSKDGGKTFSPVPVPNPDDRTQGDDVILFAGGGMCVHAFITFTGLWDQAPKRASNGIAIVRSGDGGETWGDQTAVIDHLNSKTPMEDKPWLVFDRYTRSPQYGNLYCSWTRFDVYGSADPQDTSQIMFATSRDGGESFDPVIRISDSGGDCLDDDGTLEGATPSVGPDGSVYVVWAGPRGLEFDKSTDGGKTFGKDRVIGDISGGWNSDVDGILRHNGMPVTAVDHSQGANRGRLYVNWIDDRNGNKDVFLVSSADGGETWTDRVQVNASEGDNGRDQFFTWMAVDPVDGSVNIVYYDRAKTEGTMTRLTLARSLDGKSFQYFPVDIPEFKCNSTVFFGDYIGIDAQQGRVAIGFMHFRENGQLGVSSAVMDFLPNTVEMIEHGSRMAGQPERITVQHILIGFEGSLPGKDVTRSKMEAEQLASELLKRALAGEDFDALVKEFTDDEHPGIYQMANFHSIPDTTPEVTADKIFPRGGMVRGFGDVGFLLEVGQVGMSEYSAAKSKYGWHIIKRIK